MTVQSTNMCYTYCCLLILALVRVAEPLHVNSSDNTENVYIVGTKCLPPFQSVNNGCYYFSEVQMNFDDAAAYCESMGHGLNYEITLAMLDYGIEQDQAFLDAVAAKDTTFWVGGKKHDTRDQDWVWIDGRVIRHRASFWEREEPNQEENECIAAEVVTVLQGSYKRSYLYDHLCIDPLNFVCQIGMCPPNFIKIGRYCYMQSWTIDVPDLSWQYARDFCQALSVHNGFHADLAVLGVDGEDDYFLMDTLAASHPSNYIWMGAYRPDSDCHYQWIDGRELPLQSIHWSTGGPDCGSDNSVYLYYSSSYTRAWLDDDHGDDYSTPFVCQMFKDA